MFCCTELKLQHVYVNEEIERKKLKQQKQGLKIRDLPVNITSRLYRIAQYDNYSRLFF
jgi:hypothetical protein